MVSGKRTFFFVMHENDFDFMLPLIYHADRPTVFLYGTAISRHPGYTHIRANVVDLTGGAFRDGVSPAVDASARGLSRLGLGSVAPTIMRSARRRVLNGMTARLALYLRGVRSTDVGTVVFDHGTDDGKQRLVPVIRNWAGTQVPIISVPHGVSSITNRMQSLSDLEPHSDQSKHEMFDLVVANDQWHQESFIAGGVSRSKVRTIANLRYTHQWQDVFRKLLLDAPAPQAGEAGRALTCVVLLTKFQANIFTEELIRCLRIILLTKRVKLVLKPHPRGRREADALRESLSPEVEIASGHVIEALEPADFVLALPSSAIHDALLMNKTVLFPSFVTSSVLNPDLLRQVNELRCADELYAAVHALVAGRAVVTTPAEDVSYADIVAQWQEIIQLSRGNVRTPIEAVPIP